MDTFEQIQLEEETKRLIDSYRREYTNKELKRLDEIEGFLGAKHPGEIDLWMDVWDYWSQSYNTGIAKTYLADATMTATGLTRSKAKDAVSIGKDFDLLIEAKPADTDDPSVDEDATVLRLVQPKERPDLFVESTSDLKAFADRDKWVDIWETLNEPTEPFKRGQLNTLVERLTFADTQTEVDAVVAVGVLCGSLVEEDDDYVRICSERPRDIWLRVWDQMDAPLNHPLPANEVQLSLGIELLDADISGEDYFESALEHNELYSPEDLADDQYVVNDPASEEGPEIIEREGTDPFDDSDDNSDSMVPNDAENTPSTEANTHASSGETATREPQDGSQDPENEQADAESVTAAEASQEAADAAETHDTVEGEQSVAPNSEDESTASEADEDDLRHDHQFESQIDVYTEDLETIYGTKESPKATESEDAPTDEGDTGSNTDADEEDKLARFLTYREPQDVDDDFDLDRDAVQQFVDEFCKVDIDAGKTIKISREEVFNAFTKWSEMNGLSLGRLHESLPNSTRKSALKEILQDVTGVGVGRPQINGKKTSAYYSIYMTDSGYELVKTK